MNVIKLYPHETLTGTVYGLGATNTQVITTAQTVSTLATTASQIVPPADGYYSSDFSKVSGKIATIAGTAAAVVQVIPGVGQVVGAVLGAVAAVAFVLSKVFSNSKARKLAAERQQYEILNKELTAENYELDAHYVQLRNTVYELRNTLEQYTGKTFNGLGFCLFNCKRKEEEKKLKTAKDQYNELKALNEEKIKAIELLLDEINRTFEAITGIKKFSTANKFLLAGLVVSAAVTGLILYNRKKKKA